MNIKATAKLVYAIIGTIFLIGGGAVMLTGSTGERVLDQCADR